MSILKRILIYGIIEAVAFGLQFLLVFLADIVEEKAKRDSLIKVPYLWPAVAYMLGFVAACASYTVYSVPVLFIVSGLPKVFSVILMLVLFVGCLYGAFVCSGLVWEYEDMFDTPRWFGGIFYFISVLYSDYIIYAGVIALSTAFDISITATSVAHVSVFSAYLILCIVLFFIRTRRSAR